MSINLLGGLPDPVPDPDDLKVYDIRIDDVSGIAIILYVSILLVGYAYIAIKLALHQ